VRRVLRACGLAALLGLTGSLALGDEITLNNGKTIHGKIVRRQGGQVVIQLDNGGRITIAESKVVLVKPDDDGGAKPPTKVQEPPQQPRPQPSGEEKPPAETAPEKPETKPDPKLQARIDALVEALAAKDEDGGREPAIAARAELVRIGEPALGALCKALEDASWQRRFYAAKALGEIGSKKSTRALLAALFTGTPPKGQKAVWWDRSFLRTCADSFSKVTGASFNYDADNALVGEEIEKMLTWWTDNAKDYPEQIGAPPVKAPAEAGAKPPDPSEEIRKLPPRKFPAPSSEGSER
jgi:hypothetical protein